MNGYLLDTHVLIWWWQNPKQLSEAVRQTIENPHNQIFVSAINLWEMSIKYHKGKLPIAKLIIDDFENLAMSNSFDVLSITTAHARLAGELPQIHADPFDRMLVAQAISEGLTLISKDDKIHQFDAKILW